ncbi:zinc finger BED domain-containing protein RICESLEEPER [Trifolium repens]|nr:zinc finger BED domain-containing protein RICESLEEPER [Trifolium repens]
MARKRKAQTEIVPDEVPLAPTREAQNTPNETPLENQDAEAAVEPTVSPNKKVLKSYVWPHFRRKKINGVWKAICKHCDKKLGGDTPAGTTHLRDHLRICPLRTTRGPNQALLKVT